MTAYLAGYVYAHLATFIACLALTRLIRARLERDIIAIQAPIVFSGVFLFTHLPLVRFSALSPIDAAVIVAECGLAAFWSGRALVLAIAALILGMERFAPSSEVDEGAADFPPVVIGPDGPER